MVIVSPHLDDAVFSCGHFMAQHPGCTVLTVFAGLPAPECALPEWDAHCGFTSARGAVLARRQEDRQALAALAATPVWLDFLDSQYGQPCCPSVLARALDEALDTLDSGTVLVPLGLFHSDHLLVHEAARQLMATPSETKRKRQWRLYEEVPYRGMPAWVPRRVKAVRSEGLHLTLEVIPPEQPDGLKARAARCYASQWQALGAPLWQALELPEHHWLAQPAVAALTTAPTAAPPAPPAQEAPHGV